MRNGLDTVTGHHGGRCRPVPRAFVAVDDCLSARSPRSVRPGRRLTLRAHDISSTIRHEDQARSELLLGVSADVRRDHDESQNESDRLEVGEPERYESSPFSFGRQVGQASGGGNAHNVPESAHDDTS